MINKKLEVSDITPEDISCIQMLTNRFGDRDLPTAEREVRSLLGWGLWNLTPGALAALNCIISDQYQIAHEAWSVKLQKMFNPKPTNTKS